MSNVVPISAAVNYDPNGKPPEFIVPIDLTQFTDAQLDELVSSIQQRRLVAHHRFNDSKRLRNAADKNNLSVRYDKVMHKMAVELDKYDKYVTKLEAAANELRALRLQLGADPL